MPPIEEEVMAVEDEELEDVDDEVDEDDDDEVIESAEDELAPAETISPFSSVIIGGGRVVLVQSSTGTWGHMIVGQH